MLIPVSRLSLWELAGEIRDRLFKSRKQNGKLGDGYAWSLPSVQTCPGATMLCVSKCYAKRLEARRSNVRKSWHRALELTHHPLFSDALALALKGLPSGQLRIHVSGDFYSPAYLNAWVKAVKGAPQLAPFAFTRSWRVPAIKAALKRAGWPAWILASTDAESGAGPEEMRQASMADVSLRAIRAGTVAAPAGLCPEQKGTKDSCASCGLCPMATATFLELKKMPAAVKYGPVFAVH